MIHLDNNATTRPAPEAVDAMTACLRQTWGNASSSHALGQAAKRLLAESRAAVAALVDAQPAEVIFTSGATEANHTVLAGLLAQSGTAVPRVLMSAIEHAALLKSAQALAQAGRIALQLLPVDAQGVVDVDAALALIQPGTALICLMAANNETGVLQPLERVAARAREVGALLHVDATQAIGKLPFSFAQSQADFVTLSAHKLHGPKGVGALLLRKGLRWPALLPGSQERARRGGTENLPGIAGFAAAALLAREHLDARVWRMAGLRQHLEARLRRELHATIHGDAAPRLPNTTNFRIGEFDAEPLLSRLERRGIAAASGAACSSGGQAPSHVLLAMGLSSQQARAAIRISLSHETTQAEVDACVDALAEACATAALDSAAA